MAKERMGSVIRSIACHDIGSDHRRIDSMQVQYHDITFKHILLPIWLSAYHYRGKSVSFHGKRLYG